MYSDVRKEFLKILKIFVFLRFQKNVPILRGLPPCRRQLAKHRWPGGHRRYTVGCGPQSAICRMQFSFHFPTFRLPRFRTTSVAVMIMVLCSWQLSEAGKKEAGMPNFIVFLKLSTFFVFFSLIFKFKKKKNSNCIIYSIKISSKQQSWDVNYRGLLNIDF